MKITGELETQEFINAFKRLDQKLLKPTKLLMGGGAAMMLAHHYPLMTFDVDAVPFQTEVSLGELDKYVKEVAREQNIPSSWLNPYFSSFTYVLPKDYNTRLVEVFKGKHLYVCALSKIDLLILKCFAGREKDVGHAKALMKKLKPQHISFVENHLDQLLEEGLPKSQEALDFFYDTQEALGK